MNVLQKSGDTKGTIQLKATNPRITKGKYASGAAYWLVSCTVKGKRYRKKHESEEAALKDRVRLIRQETGGMDAETYKDAERALHELETTKNEDAKGRDLSFAVEWFCKNYIDERKLKTVREYSDEFIAIKKAQGRRELTIREIERFQRKFTRDFARANVANIRFEELDAWISKNSNGPRSHKRVFHMVKHFFGYLSGTSENTPNPEPILSKSPFEGRGVLFQDDEVDDQISVVIFTAKECEALIREAKKHNAQRMFVWLLFTGMRPFESIRFWEERRWQWNLISPDLKYITVPKAISKTRRGRMIEVTDTLRQWLLAYRSHPSFLTANWRDKYRWVRLEVLSEPKSVAGDIPRHTLISMMIKDGKSWAEIEMQMGNKKDIQLRHYAALITCKNEVASFKNLTPEKFELDIPEEKFREITVERLKKQILINREKAIEKFGKAGGLPKSNHNLAEQENTCLYAG